MKILLIMDPGIKVPPDGYGGHERLVSILAEEYTSLGHEVYLLVTEGSIVSGCTIYSIGKRGFPASRKTRFFAIGIAWKFLYTHKKKFDLIHNFGRLIYLLPVLNSPVKKIMTYGRDIKKINIEVVNKFPNRNLIFTGCSKSLVEKRKLSGKWKVVHNTIPFHKYFPLYSLPTSGPLIFLGRLERVKGCHHAISVAKATNNNLIIAGNISNLRDERIYFEKEILPHIDHKKIFYVGEVSDFEKNKLLSTARVLLFPINWAEPFGIVMIEAMACGTPVLAFNAGSVNEIVLNGINGFIVNTEAEMQQKISACGELNRENVRATAYEKFNSRKISKEYLKVFE